MSIGIGIGLSPSLSYGGGGEVASLSNNTILSKSATLTLVGSLSGFSGTPVLTNDAGGRFLLRQNGVTWELCAGLTATDYGAATSHAIEITDAGGAKPFTITVTQITAATLAARGSIQFPRRNGATAGNAIATSAGLYGIFGANVAGGEDGAIAFFFDVRRGSLVTLSSDQDINSSPYVMGTQTGTSGRGFAVRYFPEDSSTASGTALRGRICIAGQDHASTNKIGLYLAADNDGSPTGSAVNGSFLRSAVITDDIPRLFVVRYKASTLTMDVITIRLTDFVVEQGDSKTHATWVGIGTNASRTPNLAIGTYNTAAAGAAFVGPANTVANYFPGRVSDFLITGGSGADGTNSQWQDIARGVAPSTTFSGLVRYQWTLQGTADLTQTAGSQTASSFATTGTVTTGTQMKPTNVSGLGLVPLVKGDGYTFGLGRSGATSRSITLPVSIIGTATHVQARVSRATLSGAAGDNAIVVDWTRCTSSAVTGEQTMTIAGVPVGFDYYVEFRREDDTSVVAINRQRTRVGYKVALEGQSQQDILFYGTGGPGSGISLPSTTSVSFGCHRPRMKNGRKVDVGVLEATTELSNAMLALSERLGTLVPSVPFMIVSHSQAGESLGTWYSDQVAYSGTSYKAFGDYSTFGIGFVTDVLLVAGKDISAFLHMHGTADIGRASVYASLLNAFYGGVADGNTSFSNTPSTGGPTVTTSVDKWFTAAGLEYSPHVVMIPIQRHAYVTTGAGATQVSFDTFRANYQTMRSVQNSWSPPSGVTVEIGGYTDDVQLEASTDTAHQIITDVRGNARIARRYAMAMLKSFGLSTMNPASTISGVVRTSGTVLTVSFTRPNSGALIVGSGGGAPVGFEVSEDSGATWSKTSFTSAIASNTVTLTKGGGWAAAGSLRVRYCYGGPIEYFTVSQSAGTRTTNYGLENTDLDNFLYEARTDMAPSGTGGNIQGLPIQPTFTDLTVS